MKCRIITDRKGQLQMIAMTKRTGRSDYPFYVRIKVAEGYLYQGYLKSKREVNKKIKSYANRCIFKAY